MPAKQFGSRYGRKPRKEFAVLEQSQRTRHKCPYCNKPAVRRLAAGIWQCRKCDIKFAGQAYRP